MLTEEEAGCASGEATFTADTELDENLRVQHLARTQEQTDTRGRRGQGTGAQC